MLCAATWAHDFLGDFGEGFANLPHSAGPMGPKFSSVYRPLWAGRAVVAEGLG